MFPRIFTEDNPWYSSWHTIEDAQTIPTDTLFDDNDMSSDPGDHTNDTTTPTHSQWDLSPFAHTQPDAAASITPFEPGPPSKSSSRKCVERDSFVEAGPDTHMDLGTSTEDSVCTGSNNMIICLLWCLGCTITNTQQVLPWRSWLFPITARNTA